MYSKIAPRKGASWLVCGPVHHDIGPLPAKFLLKF